MIALLDYFGNLFEHPDATDERKEAARSLLAKVNALLADAMADSVVLQLNPRTKTNVSGKGLGGFRPQDCTEGAVHSAHKEGRAVDVYDPDNHLDHWLTNARLKARDLYRENPDATLTWCHLQDRVPGSGRRTFMP